MAKIIKCIKFSLLQISTIFIRYKWQAICALGSGVITYIITFLRNTDIVYSIPIIIFVMGTIPWSILGCIKVYEFITNKNLEIIYDNGIYNEEKHLVIIKENHRIRYRFLYRVGINNTSKNTIYSVSVSIQSEIEGMKIPKRILHSHTEQYHCDINPNTIELFDLFYVGDESDFKEKKVTIIASGQNIPSVKKQIIL